MNKIAYLVLWLRVRSNGDLVIADWGIYSEPQPTSVNGTTPYAIHECTGLDFADAEKILLRYLRHDAKVNPVAAKLYNKVRRT